MNNIVYLIRHGEVEYPLDPQGQRLLYGPDVHLSEVGRKQIELLGQQLLKDKISIDVLYTSPFPRAVQTADIIGEIIGVRNIITEDKLRDTHSPGYIGMPYDDLIVIGGNVYDNPRNDNQESITDISKRVALAFKTIFDKAQKEGKTIGIVSHGDPLRILIEFLKHPENGLPDPSTMRDGDYLEKGTALKLDLDSSLRIVKSVLINSNKEGSQATERKY